jgi:hypothetical protein
MPSGPGATPDDDFKYGGIDMALGSGQDDMTLGFSHTGHAVPRFFAAQQNPKKIAFRKPFQSQTRPHEGHRAGVTRNIQKSCQRVSIYHHDPALLVGSSGMLPRLVRRM